MNMTNASKISLAKRVLSVTPSATLAISAKAKELKSQGINVIALSAGEPDFDTPDHIKDAAIHALKEGATRYTPAIGTPELRAAISHKFKRDQDLDIPADQIVVSGGAKHSIFNALFVLVDEGDEVVIPSPYWLSYTEMVSFFGGKNVIAKTAEDTNFKLTPEILKKHLTEKTKVLLLNSPSNPTGAVYTKGELIQLAGVLNDFPRVVVISDEIYEKLIFNGGTHYSIASLDSELAKRTIVVNGHSKAYAMTGWRLGYAGYPTKDLAKAVASLQSHSTSNPTAFAQAGGVEAINKGDVDAKRMLESFERRRDLFCDRISAIDGLVPFKPQGAFYLFVNIAKTGMDSITFCEKLLEEAHVAAVPGKPFGSDNHVRMSFAASEENLIEASDRIAKWLSK